MGCCVSTTNAKTAASKPHFNHNKESSPQISNTRVRNPSLTHPLPEEETVKEVLSEIPTLPKPTISKFQENEHKNALLLPFSGQRQEQQKRDDEDCILQKPRMVFHPDEISEDVSEICSSLSESVSAATERKRDITDEHDDEVNKIRQRSPANHRSKPVSGERLVGMSPKRRSEPSPNRVRLGPGRNANGLVGNVQRRGSFQSSERRSRSPVIRVNGSGSIVGPDRCPSGRRTGKSPGRVGSEFSDETRKMENFNDYDRENKSPPTSNESLENPLVSLECFIFL